MGWFPLFLLLGFAGLGWLLFGDLLSSARPVETTTVITRSADHAHNSPPPAAGSFATPAADPFSGEVLFQASGWIEASPFPFRATTLLDGVIEDVLVLEGESVEKGQLLATLVAEDSEIALQKAMARLDESRKHWETAKQRVAVAEAALATHQRQLTALEAEIELLRDESRRLKSGGTQTFSERNIEQARLAVAASEADLIALEARGDELRHSLAVAQSAVGAAFFQREAAQADVERAELDLARTEIRSPINGTIQELYAEPGRKRMLRMDDPESATIAILFDPTQLQARIDVPLEEASKLFVEQAVLVRSNFLPGVSFKGYVTRIEGRADIQRNTLQAKVILLEPDARLRPDMLCRAEFLGAPDGSSLQSQASFTRNSRIRIFVTEDALLNRDGSSASVWTLDPSGERAELRSITIRKVPDSDLIEVTEGLRPGDPIIKNAPADLVSGEKVKPITQEPS